MRLPRLLSLFLIAGLVVAGGPAFADPCGMVPPISFNGQGTPIERVGAQKTFVSWHDGVQTLVLRPGFKGKVDEFGMLIPFPSPPSLRKVDDDIFPHIAAAVDPPEVTVYVQRIAYERMARSAQEEPSEMGSAGAPLALAKDEVKVVNREAVGMYDVAVLAAGSASALKRWMDSHGFRYPDGMDQTTNEYVAEGWYFVAVKTQVGDKTGVNPQPGMTKASAKVRPGTGFDGHVQAMGFRFASKELVVPMRLSAFNAGRLRNIVYILTDGPRRIERIPKRYVVRQVSGQQLYENLTEPLPVRVMGGTWNELKPWQVQNLKNQRNPTPHNGLAKKLFADDLLAYAEGRLANPVEQTEKDLLVISEAFGLRGKELDALHGEALASRRSGAVGDALEGLKKMTLTVVDGDFDREVLASANLRFAHHVMPPERNNRESYDSRMMGPGGKKSGIVYRRTAELYLWPGTMGSKGATVPLVILVCLIPLALLARRRQRSVLMAALLALGGALVATPDAQAAAPESSAMEALIENLAFAKLAPQASKSLVEEGSAAIDPLLDTVVDSSDPVQRGWALLTLRDIGGKRVDAELKKLHDNVGLSGLVRAWAGAARLQSATDLNTLQSMTTLAQQLPALRKPLASRILALASTSSGVGGAESLLQLVAQFPQLNADLQPALQNLGVEAMIEAMRRAKTDNVRRLAASYVGAFAAQDSSVGRRVAKAYRYRKGQSKVPWSGGALFVPALSWSREDARALVGALVSWHLWADRKGQHGLKRPIHNNLRSLQLAGAAGYASPGWRDVGTLRWLEIWGRATSRSELARLLREQGVRRTPRYAGVLSTL